MENFSFCAVCKDKIFDSALIGENTGQRKPTFWYALRSGKA